MKRESEDPIFQKIFDCMDEIENFIEEKDYDLGILRLSLISVLCEITLVNGIEENRFLDDIRQTYLFLKKIIKPRKS